MTRREIAIANIRRALSSEPDMQDLTDVTDDEIIDSALALMDIELSGNPGRVYRYLERVRRDHA